MGHHNLVRNKSIRKKGWEGIKASVNAIYWTGWTVHFLQGKVRAKDVQLTCLLVHGKYSARVCSNQCHFHLLHWSWVPAWIIKAWWYLKEFWLSDQFSNCKCNLRDWISKMLVCLIHWTHLRQTLPWKNWFVRDCQPIDVNRSLITHSHKIISWEYFKELSTIQRDTLDLVFSICIRTHWMKCSVTSLKSVTGLK